MLYRTIVQGVNPNPDPETPRWDGFTSALICAYGGVSPTLRDWSSDQDNSDAELRYEKLGTWPAHLVLNQNGTISATVNTPVGDYQLQARVYDPGDLFADSPIFTLSVVKGINRLHTWLVFPSRQMSVGGVLQAKNNLQDLDGVQNETFTFTSGNLPAGFSLEPISGDVTNVSAAGGLSLSFNITATDGSGNAVPSGPIQVNTVAAVATTFEVLPVVWAEKHDTVYPDEGILWNISHADNDGGFIGWCDGNHGGGAGTQEPPASDQNSIRYYNTTDKTIHGIAPGQTGYLLSPRDAYYQSGANYDGPTPPATDGSRPPLRQSAQIRAATTGRFPYLYMGWKVREPIVGGVVRLWRGTAANKVALIREIADGTPAATGVPTDTFPDNPNGSSGRLDYDDAISCPEGFYAEFVPTGASMGGAISVLRRLSYPALTEPFYAPASNYDNKQWWFIPSENKFFWTPNYTADGGREGIYDMALNRWSHGNRQHNANMWPTGPYWFDYIKRPTETPNQTVEIGSNQPTTFCEALDCAVATRVNGVWLIRRNPNYPTESHPWKIQLIGYSQAVAPFVPTVSSGSTGWNNSYMQGMVAKGEWIYCIKPMSTAERSLLPSVNDLRFYRFWLREILDGATPQFQELARFENWHNVAGSAHGTKLLSDADSNTILAFWDDLKVYDVDLNLWTTKNPTNWKRIRNVHAIGPLPSKNIAGGRDYVFRNSFRDTEPNVNGLSATQYFNRVTFTGGKAPMRYAPRSVEMDFQSGSIPRPWSGKHLRFIYARENNKVAGGKERLAAGKIIQVGGDYIGYPYSNSLRLTNMPYWISTYSAVLSSENQIGEVSYPYERSTTGTAFTSSSDTKYFGYLVTETIAGGEIKIWESSARVTLRATLTPGTVAGTRVELTSSQSGCFVEFMPGATGKVLVLTGSPRLASQVFFKWHVNRTLQGAVKIWNGTAPTPGDLSKLLCTIPAGTARGANGGFDVNDGSYRIPPTTTPNGIYVEYSGDGGVIVTRESGSSTDSERSDLWYADARNNLDASGNLVQKLFCNPVPFYPWNPGDTITLDPEVDFGPQHPDGVGLVVDKRGDVIVGPGYYRFSMDTLPPVKGPREGFFRLRLPDKHTNEVRKGNGWHHYPTQNYIRPSRILLDGGSIVDNPLFQAGVDIDLGEQASIGTSTHGGSNVWTCYDPIRDHVIMFCSAGTAGFRLFKFDPNPASPTYAQCLPRESYTRDNTDRQKYLDKINAIMLVNSPTAAPFTLTDAPSKYYVGPQFVINDSIYSCIMVGGGGGYGIRKSWHLLKVPLTDYSKWEVIAPPLLPNGKYLHWTRSFDAPNAPGQTEVVDSVNETRSANAMGHLFVLSPPSIGYMVDEPWIAWLNTNSGKWTLGLSYEQCRQMAVAEDPNNETLWPATPSMQRGGAAANPEAGEQWTMQTGSPGGVFFYRIW